MRPEQVTALLDLPPHPGWGSGLWRQQPDYGGLETPSGLCTGQVCADRCWKVPCRREAPTANLCTPGAVDATVSGRPPPLQTHLPGDAEAHGHSHPTNRFLDPQAGCEPLLLGERERAPSGAPQPHPPAGHGQLTKQALQTSPRVSRTPSRLWGAGPELMKSLRCLQKVGRRQAGNTSRKTSY